MTELEILHAILNENSFIPISSEVVGIMENLLACLRVVDSNQFQIAKNAFITLSKIVRSIDLDEATVKLTDEEKIHFPKLNTAFNNPTFMEHVNALRNNIAQNPSIREIVVITQHVFSGECLGLVSLAESNTKQNALIFSRNRTLSQAENTALQQKITVAEETTKKVGSLCARYRL